MSDADCDQEPSSREAGYELLSLNCESNVPMVDASVHEAHFAADACDFEGAYDKRQLRTSSRELSQLVGQIGHGYKKRSY